MIIWEETPLSRERSGPQGYTQNAHGVRAEGHRNLVNNRASSCEPFQSLFNGYRCLRPQKARLPCKTECGDKSIAAILKEVMTNEASALMDTDAENKALDADAALQDLGADQVGQAYVTATVTVWDGTRAQADAKLRLVEKTIQGRDFTCMVERANAVEAWLGSLPGHVYANVRTPPISTLNLAHMIPLSAVWAGPERNEHLGGPPLFFARTEGSTPFRFSPHVGDVGHTLVVGPTGAGKSVLLALMALQFRRYAGAQVFAFDFGGSIRASALAMGGDFHDLGGALAEAAEARSRCSRCRGSTLPPSAPGRPNGWPPCSGVSVSAITPEVKEHLWTALGSLASAPAPSAR